MWIRRKESIFVSHPTPDKSSVMIILPKWNDKIQNFYFEFSFLQLHFYHIILKYVFQPCISKYKRQIEWFNMVISVYHPITKYEIINSMINSFEIEKFCKGNKIAGLNYTTIRLHNANSISFQETSHRNESDQIYFVCLWYFLLALSN